MSTVLIRPAVLEDLETLLKFEQGVIEAERPLDPFLNSGDLYYYDIKEMITEEHTHLVVAVSENELVGSGYIKVENSKQYHKNLLHGYIGFMYVKPSFRGKRISSILLGSLKEWAKSKNLKELRLDVYHNNDNALKAYQRFGFSKSLVNMRMEI